MSIDKLKTKFFTGSFVNDVKHYFSKINEIIDWINNIGSTTVPSYSIYTALLDQTGTNNPTAIVLENTLSGTIAWTYDSVGSYLGTLTGAFDEDKTFIQITPRDYGRTYDMFVNNINSIYVEQVLADGVQTSVNGLTKLCIEIRVYN